MTPGSLSQEPSPSSSTPIVSEPFKHAQNFTIGDYSNFSTVNGDQHNHYTIQEQKKRLRIVGTDEEEAEYEQFRQVLRGDVIALRDVHWGAIGERFNKEQWEWVGYGEKTVVAGKVMMGGVAIECTAVSYSGEGAEEAWKEEFRRLGGARRPENAQLVAINLSSVPMLVLTGDLVPAAHLAGRVGGIGKMYLYALVHQMDCSLDDSLWMDTSRGVFCRGPEGPWWFGSRLELDNLPLDAELVKEDVLYRYLASRIGDRGVVGWLSWEFKRGNAQVKVYQPTVISTLDNTILAVGSGVWRVYEVSCLGERTELPNGTTRFTLKRNRYRRLWLELDAFEAQCDWLAQALSVFHAHGISLEGDMSAYKLVIPERLEGTLSQSKAKRRRRRKCPPIYLFVLPLSTSTFWSFNQDGQTPIPTNLCRHLGLPPSLSPTTYKHKWPTSTYKQLRDYQVARNFDPTTADFAQHNKRRIYEVVKTSLPSRFEEIDNLATIEDFPSPKTFTRSSSIACTSDDGYQVLDIEDMSLGLLFDNMPLEACRHSTLVATPATHEGSSADSRRRTSGRLLQKGSPSKPPAPSSVFQAAVSGLKTSSKPMAPRPVRTSAKPMTVPKPREVTTRTEAPPSRKTPLSSVKDGTKAIPPAIRGTTPHVPPYSSGSILRGTEASALGTVNTVSRTLPVKPMSKPVSAEARSSPNASGSTSPSTSGIKATLPRSSGIHSSRPDRMINSTERATTPESSAPSALLPTASRKTGTATTTKRTIPHPTTSRSNGAATVPQRPSPTPRPSTLRTPRPGASSPGVTTRADTVQERKGVQERIGTTRIKEASGSNPPSRSPVVATSRVTRPLATRPSVRRS